MAKKKMGKVESHHQQTQSLSRPFTPIQTPTSNDHITVPKHCSASELTQKNNVPSKPTGRNTESHTYLTTNEQPNNHRLMPQFTPVNRKRKDAVVPLSQPKTDLSKEQEVVTNETASSKLDSIVQHNDSCIRQKSVCNENCDNERSDCVKQSKVEQHSPPHDVVDNGEQDVKSYDTVVEDLCADGDNIIEDGDLVCSSINGTKRKREQICTPLSQQTSFSKLQSHPQPQHSLKHHNHHHNGHHFAHLQHMPLPPHPHHPQPLSIPTMGNTVGGNASRHQHHHQHHTIHPGNASHLQPPTLVSLPAIPSSCLMQHSTNQHQHATLNNANAIIPSDFLQHPSQNNQHYPQSLHQQTTFPIVTTHPHQVIGQIPLHFPSIVTNQNIIPLTTHVQQTNVPLTPHTTPHTTPPSSQCNQQFTANLDQQAIINSQQQSQNFIHQWQIQLQKHHQQQRQQNQIYHHPRTHYHHHHHQNHLQQCQHLHLQQKQPALQNGMFYQQPLKPTQHVNPLQSINFLPMQQSAPLQQAPNFTLEPNNHCQDHTTDTDQQKHNLNATPFNISQIPERSQQITCVENFVQAISNTATTTTTVTTTTASTSSMTPMTTEATTTAACVGNNQGVNLYVKHLEDDVDDNVLKKMFSRFGEVVSAKVMMEGQSSRGFGFVCFARAEDAARATRDIRRKTDDLSMKNLYVAPAQRKEERQAFFREKLKSFMGEPTQQGTSSKDGEKVFSSANCRDRSSKPPHHNATSSLMPAPASKGEELSVNVAIFQPRQTVTDRTSKKTDDISVKPKLSPFSGKRSGISCSQPQSGKPLKNIFDLDNFSLERLNMPFVQPAHIAPCVSQATVYNGGNHESQSEPIPDWFFEADDEWDGSNQRMESQNDSLNTPCEFISDNSNFDQGYQSCACMNQSWFPFEIPTSTGKYENKRDTRSPSNSNDLASVPAYNSGLVLQIPATRETVSFEAPVGEELAIENFYSDCEEVPPWLIEDTWCCALIPKQETPNTLEVSDNSGPSCSSTPDSLYECKKLATDCIACCTDTDSAEEEDGEHRQDSGQNNSNIDDLYQQNEKVKEEDYDNSVSSHKRGYSGCGCGDSECGGKMSSSPPRSTIVAGCMNVLPKSGHTKGLRKRKCSDDKWAEHLEHTPAKQKRLPPKRKACLSQSSNTILILSQ